MGIKVTSTMDEAFEKWMEAVREIEKQNGADVDQAIQALGGEPDRLHDINPITKDPKVAQKAAKSEADKDNYMRFENKGIEIGKLIAKKLE